MHDIYITEILETAIEKERCQYLCDLITFLLNFTFFFSELNIKALSKAWNMQSLLYLFHVIYLFIYLLFPIKDFLP